MTRSEAQYVVVDVKPPRKKSNRFNRVFNRDSQRVRGLWERNGIYYAQIRVSGRKVRLRLEHATTVPQALEEMQALKKQRRDGNLKAPRKKSVLLQKGAQPTEKGAQPSGKEAPVGGPDSPLKDTISGYKHHRDTMETKDPKTAKRENSGLRKWIERFGDIPIGEIDGGTPSAYALWRKEDAKKQGKKLGGRAIDLDVMALQHVLRWAVTNKWLHKMPDMTWAKLAKKPAQDRLISPEELDQLCSAAILKPEALRLLDPKVRHLRAAQAITGQAFSDYMRLMAYCGGREQETIQLRWSNVLWDRRCLHFPGASQGGKRGAGSQEAGGPRYVDFYGKLENHLKEMFARRDPSTDVLFPSRDGQGPVKSYRKQLARVKQDTKLGRREVRTSEKFEARKPDPAIWSERC